MADPVTQKNKSIPREVPPTPAVGEAVVKILRGMSKLLEDFHDDPVQHAHCIRLFKIYLDTLKEKSEEWADEPLGATTAVAKSPSGTKEEPRRDDKEYIDSGHNSVDEDEESDVETEDDVDRDISEFLGQSNEGEAAEEDKAKDGREAEAEDGGEAEAEAEDGREAAAKEEAGGSDGAEDTMRVSKARKKGLLPIKFNLSEDFDIAYITGARDEFFAAVRLLKFDALTNNKKTVMSVTEEDAIRITNFFFSQIMGKPALNRLSSLVQSYNKRDDAEPDKGVPERAQEAARRTTNRTLKHFFETVGKSEASSRSTNSIIHQIYIIRMHMELTDAYIELVKEATFTSKATKEEKAKKKALKTELRLKGCPTAKGKGLKSAMIQYVCRELVMERNALDYRTQCGKSVKCLVDQVGPGIIPVLPEGGMNVLHRFNAQVMAQVYPILLQTASFLKPICEIINETIYQPLAIGQPLEIRAIKTTGNNLLNSLNKAIEEADKMEVD